MSPDQLTAIIDRMTAGSWRSSRHGGFICTDKFQSLFSIVNCDGDTLANREAVVALANHAEALVECAKLLRDIRAMIHTSHRFDGMTIEFTHNYVEGLDSALKRLEEIK